MGLKISDWYGILLEWSVTPLIGLGGYRGSKSMPSQKGVRTNYAYHEAAQRQLASLTQMSAKYYTRSTKGIKLSAAINA